MNRVLTLCRNASVQRGMKVSLQAIVLVVSLSTALVAQIPSDSLLQLQEALRQKKDDLQAMERMLRSLSVYMAHCPSWVVLDENLRHRVHTIMQMRSSTREPDTALVVIANPQRTQILELRSGSITMGRRDIHVSLSDSLKLEILEGIYPKRMLDLNPGETRNPMLFGYVPRFAALSLSGFGATLLFNNGRGIEVKLGHEEIGYHFWSTGSAQIMAVFEQFRLGIIAPFRFGNTPTDAVIQPLAIRPRLLTGSKGIVLHYDSALPSEQISAHFAIGEVRGFTNPDILAGTTDIYSVHTVAQLTYARQETFGSGLHLFTFKGGLGYHQIATGSFGTGGGIQTTAKENFVSPILAVDYVHEGNWLYGLGVQYYSSIVFAKGWVELIKDFLFIDIKYYAPIFRDAKPWEQPYFFMVSPRIQVVY
jgi:hypothetical protein